MLLYPPTDLKDLISKYKAGYFSGSRVDIERTMKIVSDFIGTDVKLLSVDNSAVLKNSFANKISFSSESAPPVFMLHGVSDELVPVSQSITMCNAYGGSASEMPDKPRNIFTCGDSGSLLHLVQQGEHGMDNCLMDLGGPCQAGDSSSRHLAADSLRQAREWLKQLQTRNGDNASASNITTLMLTASANAVQVGETYTLTATVTGINPTGKVTFTDGTNVLGIATLTSGQGILTVSHSEIGSHIITAQYDGDTLNKGSISSIQIRVNNINHSGISLTANMNPALIGDSVILTAIIPGDAATGTIAFSDDIGLLGVVSIVDNKAEFTTHFPTTGLRNIVASYSGDENHPAISTKLSLLIQGYREEQVLPVILQLLLNE